MIFKIQTHQCKNNFKIKLARYGLWGSTARTQYLKLCRCIKLDAVRALHVPRPNVVVEYCINKRINSNKGKQVHKSLSSF